MKKLFNLSLVAAAVMTIFSCSKEIDQPITEASSAKTFTFNVVNGGVDTKASLNPTATAFQWEDGDNVGVYLGSNANLTCPVNKEASTAKITITPTVEAVKDNIILGYFPYSVESTGSSAAKVVIPSEQNGETIANAMPMYSTPIVIDETMVADKESYQTMYFNNLAGVLEFNVYSTNVAYQSEVVKSIKFQKDGVSGTFNVNLTDADPALKDNTPSATDAVTATLTTEKQVVSKEAGEKTLVYMVVAPGTYASAVVTVTTDKAVYIATLPNDLTVAKNQIIPFNLNLNNSNFERHPIITFGSDWNAVFGTSYTGTISSVKADALTLEGNSSIVSINVNNGTSTSGYVKTGDFRLYNGYSMTISVPTEVKIVRITSTKGGKTFTEGIDTTEGDLTIENNSINWTGSASSVVFNITGTISFATITVTLALGDYVITEYNVIYNENKPAGAAKDVSGMPENAKSYPGSFTLSSTTPELEGYVFKGWGATADATDYIKSVSIKDKDVNVYAIWEEKGESTPQTATIIFSTNDVKVSSKYVTGKDDKELQWTITTEGTTSFTSQPTYCQIGSSSKPANSITFTATPTSNITITGVEAKFGGFSGTAGTITYTVGGTQVATGSLNAVNDVTISNGDTPLNVNAQNKELKVSVTGISKGVKVYYISYTYIEN